jgi:hypothetical protein
MGNDFENKVLEDTLLELCNSVWFNTLMQLRDRAHSVKTMYDYENDPDYQFREGILNANSRTLGSLLERVGNGDLSLLVNRLKLCIEE